MLVDVFLHSRTPQDIFNPRNYSYIECAILKTEVDLLGYTSVTQGKWFTNSTPGYYRNTDSINNSNVTTPIEITKEHVYHSTQEIAFLIRYGIVQTAE